MQNIRKRKPANMIWRLSLIFIMLIIGVAICIKQTGRENFVKPEPHMQAEQNPKIRPKDTWELLLVNGVQPLPDGYQPVVKETERGYLFDQRAVGALEDMLDAARKEGLSPLICSAYRTGGTQRKLYEGQVEKQRKKGLKNNEAEEEAKKVVAFPGTSEHQLGLAVDIVSLNYQLLDEAQANTQEAKWLREHCKEFGFILRYPPDKSEKTGVIFEPWHFRYVGKDAAKEIMEQNICLEEYLER